MEGDDFAGSKAGELFVTVRRHREKFGIRRTIDSLCCRHLDTLQARLGQPSSM
jgi:hypothetical protein